VVQLYDRNLTAPRYVAFRLAFSKLFGRDPGQTATLSYDAINVVMEAIGRQKVGESLKQTLLNMGEVEGLQSSFRFDAFGDVMRPPPHISTVRGGQFILVE
jgi:branched-chain amino acid transport system substrate-binding protein